MSATPAEKPVNLADRLPDGYHGLAAVPDPPVATTRAPKPPMADRIAAEQEADPLAHTWIAAAEVAIDTPTARRASYRGSFRTEEEGFRIEALETYCRGCRRPLDEVLNEPCAAKIDNTHLIGGDQTVRAKRLVPEVKGVIQYQVIDRRHMAGYSVHAGK